LSHPVVQTEHSTNYSNEHLRSALIESAWVAIRNDEALLFAFNQLAKRMKKTDAIVRIAKKLLNRVRFV
jgi:transposase